MTGARRLVVASIVLAMAGRAEALRAQVDQPPGGQQPAPDVAGLVRLVEQQGKLLDAQRTLIEELTKRLEETNRLVAASQQRLSELEQRAVSAAPQVQHRLDEIEQSLHQVPELTQRELEGEDFPGSFRIPGTEAGVRFGGQVRTLLVRNFGPLGTEDRFVTSSIPIEGTADAGKASRTTISASPSRLETDFRTPTPFGPLRAFVSGDFAGANRTYRLRHAFGQWRSILIGQTWSAFSDPEAEPDGLDFEGLNAISLFRQPGIRWTHAMGERTELAVAIENPSPDLTGASGVNQVPDVIVRVRFNASETAQTRGLLFRGAGHTQAAILFRQVRGEPTDRPNHVVSTPGIGIHVSGRRSVPWRRQDYVKFATAAGRGIGRYITDLGTLGGHDAVYDPLQDELVALSVYSTYVGYEHWWTRTLRSTGTFGLVFVDNVGIQTADALHTTTRSSFNLSWSPVSRVDLIAELLAGRRVNKDRQDGRAAQMQVGWIFRF